MRGPRGIDKALINRGSYPALRAIGYLATHDGAFSDHVVGFMDWDAQLFSQGMINRPPRYHSREITFDQSDKVKKYLEELIKQASGRKLMERTTRLAAKFVKHGPDPRAMQEYNDLYKEAITLCKNVAFKTGKKKYGHMRSPSLTLTGGWVRFYRQILECKKRNAPLSSPLVAHALVNGMKCAFALSREWLPLGR